MTDQNSQFFAILTAVGEAKQANANALGVPWTFAQLGVGDANLTDPIPARTQTRLINERRRAPLNQVKVDPANASVIIAEQIIPPDVGGWWIREIGLYDADGDLVAVANCAPSFKPLLSQGTGKTQVVRLNIIVTSTANIQLRIDPAVVLATREYVDGKTQRATETTFGVTKLATQDQANAGSDDTTTITPLKMAVTLGTLLKQATESVLGVTRLASSMEVDIGTNGDKTVTPLTLQKKIGDLWKQATESTFGVTRLATQDQANAGADDTRTITPLKMAVALGHLLKQATETTFGVTKLATQDQANAGSDDTTTITPLKMAVTLGTLLKQSTETVLGVIRLASSTEVDIGTNGDKAVTPLTLQKKIGDLWKQSTESRFGVTRLATQDQANAGADDTTTVTPLKMAVALGSLLKQATESRFGVTRLATQDQANAGADDTTTVTPLKMAVALGSLLKQATEATFGIVRIANQAETDLGTNDEKMVTPLKLRYGFSASFTSRGHIALPSWLGGLVVNWGLEAGIPAATDSPGSVGPTRDATLSLAFPNQSFGVLCSMAFHTMVTQSARAPGATAISNSVVRVQNNYTGSLGNIFWIALGN